MLHVKENVHAAGKKNVQALAQAQVQVQNTKKLTHMSSTILKYSQRNSPIAEKILTCPQQALSYGEHTGAETCVTSYRLHQTGVRHLRGIRN